MVGEAVTGQLASQEVQDVTREFSDLVTVENLPGLAFVSVVTAGGVAIAQQLVDLVIPRMPDDLGLDADPRRARDFFAAGLLEAIWAFGVGLVAVKFIGTDRPFLFATAIGLAIGAFAIAGANFIEWGQRVVGMATAKLSELDESTASDATGGAADQAAAAAGSDKPVAADGGRNIDDYAGGVVPTAV